MLDASFTCAYCGETIETTVDPSAGRFQQYVEDCQVCCRPNVLHIEVENEGEDLTAHIEADPESD